MMEELKIIVQSLEYPSTLNCTFYYEGLASHVRY
jgi:hypothetical protein